MRLDKGSALFNFQPCTDYISVCNSLMSDTNTNPPAPCDNLGSAIIINSLDAKLVASVIF